MKNLKLKINVGKLSLILIGVMVLLTAADLILKYVEVKYDWNFVVIPKIIWVESGCLNTGAAFSFLADEAWGRVFLIVITIIMTLALLVVFALLPERFVIMKIALALIVSGAIGNLVDRIMLGGVRDFVFVNMIFSAPCCNFADFWIVFGVIIAAIDMLFLNEYCVFPLTKKAKEAQRLQAEKEKEEKENK